MSFFLINPNIIITYAGKTKPSIACEADRSG